MHEWSPEVSLQEGAVRGLLEQFPALPVRSLRPLDAGWDNAVWLVNDAWAFRFPHRAIAVPLAEREIAVLPAIERRMTLPIPVPTFIGHPAGDYPWPFFGAPYLPGRELAASGLAHDRRVAAAEALGTFLRRLHDPALLGDVDVELPADPNRRADMRVREPRARHRLEELEALGLWRRTDAVERLLIDALALPDAPPAIPVLTHGDLHVRHVLVDDDGAVTGIIDWGDVCVADPGIDLSIAYSAFRGPARAALLGAYGSVSEDQRLRARVLALFLSSTLAIYAHHSGMLALEAEALCGLERAIEP